MPYTPTNWQDGVTDVTAALMNKIEAELAALAAGGSTDLNYKGDWVAGTYNDGDIVVYQGIVYICTKQGITTPPDVFPPAGAQDAIPKSLIDAAGDLILGTANDSPAKLSVGATVGHVLTRLAASPFVGWQALPAAPVYPGTELDYAQIIANAAAVSASTEATAVAIITGNPVTYDGTRVKIEIFTAGASNGVAAQGFAMAVCLRDATVIGQLPLTSVNGGGLSAGSVLATFFDTPSAGTHTYKFSLFVSGGSTATYTIQAGPGGSGARAPSYLRVTKA
jgi:hypothetical protein